MNNDNTQDGAEPSPASAGSHVVAWAVVNPSGGTRFLGLTNEDAQREATTSERVMPVHWPTLTDAEREAIYHGAASLRLEAMRRNRRYQQRFRAMADTLQSLRERLS